MTEPVVDSTLARTFNFDAADLAANRAGRLSPDQARLFANAVRVERRRGPRMLVLVVLLFAGAIVAAIVGSGDQLSGTMIAVLAAIMVVPITLVVVFAVIGRQRVAALEHPDVRVTVGRPVRSSTATPGFWKVRIGDVTFQLMAGDTDAFHDDRVYRVYYLPMGAGSPGILSAEVVDGP